MLVQMLMVNCGRQFSCAMLLKKYRNFCWVKKHASDWELLARVSPAIGSAADQRPVVAEVTDAPNADQFDLEPCASEEDGSCKCPRRDVVPEPPKFDPQLSVPQHRRKIIEHYASLAFNKCTRQTLPLMKGEPLPIPVRSSSTLGGES